MVYLQFVPEFSMVLDWFFVVTINLAFTVILSRLTNATERLY